MIFRWDLDKTYLRTEFDTVSDLLRRAFESPRNKRAVPGATTLLRELGKLDHSRIEILSASPEQMRQSLETKLRIDGLRWDSFVLKPSVQRLFKGRFRFLRDKVGYKLLFLLHARMMADGHREILFGDDAEWDGFVYVLYANICAGKVPRDEVERILYEARVYPQETRTVMALVDQVAGHGDVVDRVLLHLDRGRPPNAFSELGALVVPFHNYFQAALILHNGGHLSAHSVVRVLQGMLEHHFFHAGLAQESVSDLWRRGMLRRERMEHLHGARLPTSEDSNAVTLLRSAVQRALREERASVPKRRLGHLELYRSQKEVLRAKT